MAYSRIKTWIPGEILTASDLNSEYDGGISNDNSLLGLVNGLDTDITAAEAATTALTSTVSDLSDEVDLIDNIWTYQNTAPTGWSIKASTTDAILACKGGAQAYNATGGTQAGTWTQPGHSLTIDEIAAHTHTISEAIGGVFAVNDDVVGTTGTPTGSFNTGSTGSGTSHNHGTTYRPLANIGIIIQRT